MRFLIGLFLIFILSPITLWAGESLDFLQDFKKGEMLTGIPEITSPLKCPLSENDCFYVETKVEEYKTKEEIFCGDTLPESLKVLEEVEPRCDEYGTCTDCYRVEKQEWTVNPELSKTEKAIFSLQGQEIEITPKTKIFGLQNEQVTNDSVRTTYNFLPVTENTTFVMAENTWSFFSNMNYEDTLLAVKDLQESISWALRIFSYILMVLGFIFFTSQFSGPIIGMVRVVPFLGGIVNTGAQGVIYLLVAVVATVVWAVLYLLIGFLAGFVSLINLFS